MGKLITIARDQLEVPINSPFSFTLARTEPITYMAGCLHLCVAFSCVAHSCLVKKAMLLLHKLTFSTMQVLSQIAVALEVARSPLNWTGEEAAHMDIITS